MSNTGKLDTLLNNDASAIFRTIKDLLFISTTEHIEMETSRVHRHENEINLTMRDQKVQLRMIWDMGGDNVDVLIQEKDSVLKLRYMMGDNLQVAHKIYEELCDILKVRKTNFISYREMDLSNCWFVNKHVQA